MTVPTSGRTPAGGNSVPGSWDVTSSIGVTALGVAAARAVEAGRPDALVRDRYASRLVRAADHPMPGFDGGPGGSGGSGSSGDEAWTQLVDMLAVRSRVLDDLVLRATGDGARQVVVLAAGLDARPWRLAWPAGTAVYEVDQPEVLGFKESVLADDEPACARHAVPIDLREDWGAALTGAGFDPSERSAWLVEGLLPYLPAQAEADLFAEIDRLAAPGSTIGIETLSPDTAESYVNRPEVNDLGAAIGTDIRDLWNTEPRTDVVDRLESAGWTARPHPYGELAAGLGRPFTGPLGTLAGRGRIVEAVRR